MSRMPNKRPANHFPRYRKRLAWTAKHHIKHLHLRIMRRPFPRATSQPRCPHQCLLDLRPKDHLAWSIHPHLRAHTPRMGIILPLLPFATNRVSIFLFLTKPLGRHMHLTGHLCPCKLRTMDLGHRHRRRLTLTRRICPPAMSQHRMLPAPWHRQAFRMVTRRTRLAMLSPHLPAYLVPYTNLPQTIRRHPPRGGLPMLPDMVKMIVLADLLITMGLLNVTWTVMISKERSMT